jgi:sialic acid synthase SpsE
MIIKDKKIGKGEKTFYIADIAANHDGDLHRALELIKLCAEAGADAAKFQHFKAETLVSDYGFKNLKSKQSHQKNWSKSVFEVYKDASINLEWTEKLKEECEKCGIIFFTSPYDLDLIDQIDNFIPAYKIGSGEITYLDLIKKVASKNKPYILATGASNMTEIERAVEAGIKINKNLLIMQCNTNYTADSNNFKYINLNVLKTFKKKFPHLLLGLSDHTLGHATALGAIALGVSAIEKHFTDDNLRKGPDHFFSMNPTTWKDMTLRSRELETSLGEEEKKIEKNELETIILQRRAIRAKKDLKQGEKISNENIIPLRPCPESGILPFEKEKILNKKINRDIVQGDYIGWDDLI